jgi:3'-5' exoribonuclease
MKERKPAPSDHTGAHKTYIVDILPNQEISTSLVLVEKQLRVAKNGMPFLTMKLVDKSGSITGRIWERAEEIAHQVPAKAPVFVRGTSELFRDELQLNIREIVPLSVEHIDRRDYLPAGPRDTDELLTKIRSLVASIRRESFQNLMKQLMRDRSLMDRFKAAPAAKSMHHAYLGGLLEHTASVAALVSHICDFYPDLDRDLLVTGALLHDLGKVDEFEYDVCIDYSHAGRLLGHMVLGLQIIDEKMRALKHFPSEDALLLQHLILSHHGETEYGAVRLPMTREAFVLHFADDLDAKMNSLNRILSDIPPGDNLWTPYQPLFERFFFRGFPIPSEVSPSVPADSSEQDRCIQLNLWSTSTKQEGS